MTIIETPRLRLVAPVEAHIPAYTAFHTSDRAAARGWQAMPHEAWRNFAAILGHVQLRGFGPFVAETRDEGRPIGIFGPWRPDGQPENEIKWTLWSGADEGRGFAAEAARALLAHAFGPMGWQTAVSYISADNHRSATLARHLGARHEGIWTTPRGSDVQIWRHRPGGAA